MGGAVLQACLPWLALLAVSFAVAYLLVRLNRSRIRLSRLRQLHRDQDGSVQSLSFVLTLPFFVMIILFIVQVSQLMIGTIVVHYAAYAAARSAIVWIPAMWDDLQDVEWRNCISTVDEDPDAPDQVQPIRDPSDPNYGPPEDSEDAEDGVTYRIARGGPKYEKIESAAVLACMSISPSRDVGFSLSGSGPVTAEVLKAAYAAMVPDSDTNTKIPVRLKNKLAYSMQNTKIEIRFHHKNREPPLEGPPYYFPPPYERPDDVGQFYPNEVGWQDPITVTVKHDLALLPGPGRLLARFAVRPDGSPDEVAQRSERQGKVYTFPLEASATMGNEGETSVIPYVYPRY